MHRHPNPVTPMPGPQLCVAADLAAALDRGLLTVAYQPVFALDSGAVVAVEALARLRDPRGGPDLPPARFIATAEASGLIRRIDALVAVEAMERTVGWRAQRPGVPFSLGLNVSVRDLDDPGLPDQLARQAQDIGLPCNALVVEVTETVLSRPGHGHEQVLRRLREMHINVTLDDFGTGCSSLSHLMRFPVAGVKIDRSFVTELGGGGRGERIALAVVHLAAELGVHVVAEGIETAAQLALLRAAGCTFGQGYLLGRPVPAAQISALLAGAGELPRPRPAVLPTP